MKKKKRIRIKRRPAPRHRVRIRLPKPKPEPRRKKIRIKRRPASRHRVRIRLPKPKPEPRRKKIRIRKSKVGRKIGKALGKKLGRKIREIKKGKGKLPAPGKGRAQEWLVSFRYEATGRSVDFIAVAFDADQALKFVRAELRKTESGRRMIKNFRSYVFQFQPSHYRDAEDLGEVIER